MIADCIEYVVSTVRRMPSLRFTYESYIELIELMQSKDYMITSYDNFKDYSKCIILRHDVDYSLQSAYQLAQIEQGIGIKSTYFLLLTSDFYNVFSLSSRKKIEGILECGHEIGLHFDETRYPKVLKNINNIKDYILEETNILSKSVGTMITKVSMHRPSKSILEANLKIPGIINTYSDTFCKEFKYISDSRRFWREPIEDIIGCELYNRIQILMHPFWYNRKEMNINESVKVFVNSANMERYKMMDKNISGLCDIMGQEEIH